MTDRVLIDSNVYIDLLRCGRDPAAAIGAKFEVIDVVTCGMVQLEVLRGVKLPKVQRRLTEWFSVLRYVPTMNTVWERATELAWTLDRRGRTLPGTDHIIAACALEAEAAVYSYDRHFVEYPDLLVINDPL